MAGFLKSAKSFLASKGVISGRSAADEASFQMVLAPLRNTHLPDFDFARVLSVEFTIDAKALPDVLLQSITVHNPPEWIIQELAGVITMGDELIRDGLSPGTQHVVLNGLVFIKLLVTWLYTAEGERPQELLRQVSSQLYQCVINICRLTSDETVYEPGVVLQSAALLDFLFRWPSAAAFLEHGMQNKDVFDHWFPKLLMYEGAAGVRSALPLVYGIVEAMVAFNDEQNVVRDELASRDAEAKLRNFIELLMAHVSRSETTVPALRMLVRMALYNTHFRFQFANSAKFQAIWRVLFGTVSQASMEYSSSFERNMLVIKLLYVMAGNETFVRDLLELTISRDDLDAFQIGFGVGGLNRDDAVRTGVRFTLISWFNLLLINNITRPENMSVAVLFSTEFHLATLRIMRILFDADRERLISQLRSVRQLIVDFLYQISLTLEMAANMMEQRVRAHAAVAGSDTADGLDKSVDGEEWTTLDAAGSTPSQDNADVGLAEVGDGAAKFAAAVLGDSATTPRPDKSPITTAQFVELVGHALTLMHLLMEPKTFAPLFPTIHSAIMCNETVFVRLADVCDSIKGSAQGLENVTANLETLRAYISHFHTLHATEMAGLDDPLDVDSAALAAANDMPLEDPVIDPAEGDTAYETISNAHRIQQDPSDTTKFGIE